MAVVSSACLSELFPSPTPFSSPSPSPTVSSQDSSPSTAASLEPTPTPEPRLSLVLPPTSDERPIHVDVNSDALPADGSGKVVITVTNLSTTRIVEIVLRWPTALRETVFLAPFEPSLIRIREGGPPLYQEWTKWVDGPGERGEPAGTTSLGWGPLEPGATITISLIATRRAPGPVSFDLQFLAGEAILLFETGAPAELRETLP